MYKFCYNARPYQAGRTKKTVPEKLHSVVGRVRCAPVRVFGHGQSRCAYAVGDGAGLIERLSVRAALRVSQ